MATQRKTGGREELDAAWTQVNALVADLTAVRTAEVALLARQQNEAKSYSGIGDGTTAGKLKTSMGTDFSVGGVLYNKANADDLFGLTGEVDTAADKFRAYWLLLDDSGTAAIQAGTDADSAAEAIAALPTPTAGNAVIGCYVAGLACDFDDAGGLAAQGTIYNGWPSAVAEPAALTSSTTTLIGA